MAFTPYNASLPVTQPVTAPAKTGGFTPYNASMPTTNSLNSTQTSPVQTTQPTATQQLLSAIGGGQGIGTGGVGPVSVVGLAKYAGNSIKNAFNSGVDQIKQGFQQTKNNPSFTGGLESGVNEVAGVANLVASPLAPLFAPVGDAVNAVANKISDIPAVQKFANTKASDITTRVVQDVGNINTLAGAGVGLAETDTIPKAQDLTQKVASDVKDTVNKVMTPQTPEASILADYNKAIKPTISGKTAPGQMDNYNTHVVSAVKSIASNKDNLSFTNESGESVSGQLPQTRGELADAVAQTKKALFNQYDAIAKKAGEQGAVVNLTPIAGSLDDIINNEALKITNPAAIDYAKGIQDRLTNTDGTPKTIDAETAQSVIQNYNDSLKAFYRNPTYDTASRAAIDAHIVSQIRTGLDETIKNTTGENYQELKSQYGSLSSIEKDVNKAAISQAKQTGSNTAGLGKYVDVFSGGDIVSGLLSLNPALFAKGIAQSGISHFFQWFNSPDRLVGTMFKTAAKAVK